MSETKMLDVSELSGALLDYWVAQIERTVGCVVIMKDGACYIDGGPGPCLYSPSMNWAHGGPIIDRERIGFYDRSGAGDWASAVNETVTSELGFDNPMCGTTPLVAAMRAYVASRFGTTVPDELGSPIS